MAKNVLPEVDDRVRLGKTNFTGVIMSINKIGWTHVKWDDNKHGPALCLLWELEKIE